MVSAATFFSFESSTTPRNIKAPTGSQGISTRDPESFGTIWYAGIVTGVDGMTLRSLGSKLGGHWGADGECSVNGTRSTSILGCVLEGFSFGNFEGRYPLG
jgi:hypothetical protein